MKTVRHTLMLQTHLFWPRLPVLHLRSAVLPWKTKGTWIWTRGFSLSRWSRIRSWFPIHRRPWPRTGLGMRLSRFWTRFGTWSWRRPFFTRTPRSGTAVLFSWWLGDTSVRFSWWARAGSWPAFTRRTRAWSTVPVEKRSFRFNQHAQMFFTSTANCYQSFSPRVD